VKDVGELGAGEPHAQFDGRGLETGRHGVTAPVPDPTNLRGEGDGALSEDERAELARLRRENAELAMETSDAFNLSSRGDVGLVGGGGEGGVFVVELAGGEAVVEAAEEPAEQVALGGGVPVAGLAAAVVVGAGTG
jgi:hypothetical protein